MDPPFGSEGQAAVGQKRSNELWRGRPRNQQIYPTFACRDGFVRVCLLSARQWRGMRAWLGEPDQFADPKFETIAARYAASRELNAAFAELFAPQTMEALVAEGQRRGVPDRGRAHPGGSACLRTLPRGRRAHRLRLAPGTRLSVPAGPFVIDGRHAGIDGPARQPGPTSRRGIGRAAGAATAGDAVERRPFDGLRILDLGVIVAGGELGRLFADLGADVIKVESAAYPDGLRQTPPGQPMSRSWALTHRNEHSLGLDLRHPEGADVFRRLVAESDAVFANFKPGTLASLGFSYDELRALNPRIVLAESSAFGATGPWSARMGYGPLVRATTGVSRLWRSDRPRRHRLLRRDHDLPRSRRRQDHRHRGIGRADRPGGHRCRCAVHISQAEVAVNQLATAFVAEAARAQGLTVAGDDAVHGVHPCAGDDEWCVVSVRSDARPRRPGRGAGQAELPSEPADFNAAVSAWTAGRDKDDVASAPGRRRAGRPDEPRGRRAGRSAAGVPPGLRDMVHPLFDAPMPTEQRPAPSRHIPDAELRPAPMPGEHTRQVCRDRLGLEDAEIDRLIADGVLFSWTEPDRSTESKPIMTIDPRTPVLVGYGQVNQHDERPRVEPVDLMVAAARAAADPRVLEAVDSVRIVNLLSWRYRDAGLLLAQRISAANAEHAVHRHRRERAAVAGESGLPGHPGGQRRRRTHRGRRDVAHPHSRAGPRGHLGLDQAGRLGADGARRRRGLPDGRTRWSCAFKLDRPAYVYPMFEQALRISAGESPDAHRRRIGELWAGFSAVAQHNPHAWNRNPVSAEDDLAARPGNRMISWPYPKLMNSNNMVDQGAVLILTSVEKATAPSDPYRPLGLPLCGHRRARHL